MAAFGDFLVEKKIEDPCGIYVYQCTDEKYDTDTKHIIRM